MRRLVSGKAPSAHAKHHHWFNSNQPQQKQFERSGSCLDVGSPLFSGSLWFLKVQPRARETIRRAGTFSRKGKARHGASQPSDAIIRLTNSVVINRVTTWSC